MLSYQHTYHAGNHADVLKHAVLALVIEALKAKDKPFRFIDAHAGSGIYDLRTTEARRHREHRGGIGRLLAAPAIPPALDVYLDVVRELNPDGVLRAYPGSPEIARRLGRAGDHAELLELHPRALADLRQAYGRERRVHVHERDCYEGLPALLPPPERRGVVLIDPAYEVKAEAKRAVDLLQTCHGRFPGGVYLLWYPLVPDPATGRLPGQVVATGIRRVYQAELQVEWDDYFGLRGSGMIVVNPPWGLDGVLAELLPWLWQTLAVEGRGHFTAEWLVPE